MDSVVRIVFLTCALGACASNGSRWKPWLGEIDKEPSPHEVAESVAVSRQFCGGRSTGADKAGRYRWLTAGRLYWVLGSECERELLVAAPGGGAAPVRLTGDISALKAFVSMQFNGRLPGAGALNDIAQLLKDAATSRRGVIASPEFFEDELAHEHIDDWLGGRETDPAALKKLCTGIRAHQNGNEWTLELNVINLSGGVDGLRAAGTASPLTIRQITVDVVKPNGEFAYPYE